MSNSDLRCHDKQSIRSWPPDGEHAIYDTQCEGCGQSDNQNYLDLKNSVASPSYVVPYSGDVSSESTQQCKRQSKQEPRNVYTVDVALARWWKHEGRSLFENQVSIPPGCSPHTTIHILTKSKPGQEFMQRECKRLKNLLSSHQSSINIHAALATFLEKLSKFEEAKTHLQQAISLATDEIKLKEYKWLMERVSRQLQIMHIQNQKLSQLSLKKSLTMPKSDKVERRDAKSLSMEEFLHRYASTSTPVLITGLANEITTTSWDLQHIRSIAGDCKVRLKKLNQSSVEWARLENAEETTVGQYLNDLDKQEDLALNDKRYLFDWSIPVNCPRLAEELLIPRYFAGNFLQRTAPGSLYHDSWPSLFVAPSGLRSELHVDAFRSNFWMAMFQGSKRWLFFDKEDVPLLYPQYPHSMDPVFQVDLTQCDLNQFPLLALTRPKECILQAGEVLFVPAGCPHMVTNLEQSLAISANFVDISNFDQVKQELEVNSLIDERAEDLLRQFKSETFSTDMDLDIQHTPIYVFKDASNFKKDYPPEKQ